MYSGMHLNGNTNQNHAFQNSFIKQWNNKNLALVKNQKMYNLILQKTQKN